MPVYVHCPHCAFPAVLRNGIHGRRYRCRQCAGFFVLEFPRPAREPAAPHGEAGEQQLRKAV
jgi:transposase-like protein